MVNALTLQNLKAAALTLIFAATVAAVAPSISVNFESNSASACSIAASNCDD